MLLSEGLILRLEFAAESIGKERTVFFGGRVDGFTITIKARRILDDQLVQQALSGALQSLEDSPVAKAA